MRYRAEPSGITLRDEDAALIKGMLLRGDRQHDIAAWFGVNGGRVAEIVTGQRFSEVPTASSDELPPPGPYPRGRDAVAAIHALSVAKKALVAAEEIIRRHTP
ncbi:hypothetical protein [Methylobacterium brachythecii]|uniref:Uncharacterized protein n=1 Tax=Methylobacterium brachythecii TaxID=1176177 RepID=A0A7W6FA11_9HYPH|nr:hypothetical protein [Methylobacterium brachythecii]MBB3905676.1 hypothetical protein [Methylobacterium brachythecii]GLS46946.1 hypothetical protein GCM10007884_49460 [Methylobacterium brachythecii]